LSPPSVQTSSQASAQLGAGNLVDTDMSTHWGSANNRTIGEIVTLTLATPSRLRAIGKPDQRNTQQPHGSNPEWRRTVRLQATPGPSSIVRADVGRGMG
jgi:hypothetical protein